MKDDAFTIPQKHIVAISEIRLDDLIDREPCAAWLGVASTWLAQDAMKASPKIPCFSLGHKTKRYHPRTILTVLAKRAGVSLEIIAASYGVTETKGNQ